eukprot:m.207671 g.207671  ORF g.207671 m.207671 type:complete len:215 (+) comp17792_c0_seq1:6298-6942(+)
MSAKPILYTYFRSSCSYRVRIALALKHIDYEQRAVNLLKGEQLSDSYRAVNPLGLVPSYVVDGNVLSQSLAIIDYLDETVPSPPLLPQNPLDRARVRAIAQTIACDIQPVQNLRVLKQMGDQKNEWGKKVITDGFKAVEVMLAQHAGKYCYGDSITLADICLMPQIHNAKRFEVDMTQFPTIQRVEAALEELPEFRAAHPFRQPDCPDDLKLHE